MSDENNDDYVAGLVDETTRQVSMVLGEMAWANDEIVQAIRRHPGRRDLIHHSFQHLAPTHARMATEFVFRGHCCELLDRVAAGTDTRPGTAAEVCLMCIDISKIAPFKPAAWGLFFRLWASAFPDHPIDRFDHRQYYEALKGPAIDSLEQETRAKLTVPNRTLGAITCNGRHHSEPVSCVYAT